MKEEIATFAGGCFWCTEAIFRRLKGVSKVTAGYTGGTAANPSYEAVCTGATGHAESIEIVFDPLVISYQTLLEVFFKLHDPTTLNRQGADVGTQYRSAVFYHSEEQRKTAEAVKEKMQQDIYGEKTIVTQIVPAGPFYSAEGYHQQYYEKNSYQPYCQVVIDPKIRKLMKEFSKITKEE